MVPVILAVVLSQSATCKSEYGKTACGFDCVAAYGQVRCASTPAGACEAAYGRVVCFDPPPPGWGQPVTQAQCKSAYGTTACGYQCVAAYGVVRCAQTPAGTCQAEYGRVACFDPPVPPQPGWWAPQPVTQAECKSAYGTTACGYHCVAAYGVVRCAQTPAGTCRAEAGQVTCFDP